MSTIGMARSSPYFKLHTFPFWIPIPIIHIDSWHYEELGGTQELLYGETLPIGFNRSRTSEDRYIVGIHLDYSPIENKKIVGLRIYFARNEVASSAIINFGVTFMNTNPGQSIPIEDTNDNSWPYKAGNYFQQSYKSEDHQWGYMNDEWVKVFEMRRRDSEYKISGIVLANEFTPVEIYRPEHDPGLKIEALINS